MTEDEANDRGYVEYLSEATEEKTREELRKQSATQEPKSGSREALAGHIKELQEFRSRRARGDIQRKYF